MKKTLILTGILLSTLYIVSCGSLKLPDHYSGFVIDEAGKPISGVLVREDLPIGNNDTTDSAGYFKIKRAGSLCDLIFSKKGYRTDTVEMAWPVVRGEKEMYSDLITKDTSKWVMREIVYRDSTLSWPDKLHIFDNDSIEMRRDGRLMYTQYLNRGRGEIIYRYYDYQGTVEREVYNIDMEMGEIHFRDYNKYESKNIERRGYLSTPDSMPDLLKDNLGEYWRIGVIKAMRGEELLSEKYISWRSSENCIAGRYDNCIGIKTYYNDDNRYEIEKRTEDSIAYWLYYPNGQLHEYWANKSLYGARFTSFSVSYDSLGHKTKEINWEHLFPEWGTSYNDTFSVATIRKYYPNGRLKSLTKMKSFCESEAHRCETWVYYDEMGKILKTENYGDCYNFELEEKYNDATFPEDQE